MGGRARACAGDGRGLRSGSVGLSGLAGCVLAACVLVGCVLAAPPVVRAWNASGHMQVAILVWERLPQARRMALADLLRAHPRFAEDFEARMPARVRRDKADKQAQWLFAHAAAWPDIARSQPAYNRPTWHYVNLPLFADVPAPEGFAGKVQKNARTDSRLPVSPQGARLNVLQAIALNEARLNDPSAAAADRAIALCWLLHLVADLHQPAHAAAMFTPRAFPKGDRGANRVEVGTRTLHGIWDAALGTNDSLGFVVRRAKTLQRRPGFAARCRKAAAALVPADWAAESQRLASTALYTEPVLKAFQTNEAAPKPAHSVSVSLGPRYRDTMGTRATERSIEAACRLVAMLSTEVVRPRSRWGCVGLPGT